MNATATVHITHDAHLLYHAHPGPSFDPAAHRIPQAVRIHDVPAPQHRMPQQQPAVVQQQQQPPAPPNLPTIGVKVENVGIPAMTPDGVVLVDDPESARSYTPVKVVGDGSFGTVWLCDWHSALPAGTPLSPMQCGAGARPDWVGKRLVALKRMKKPWAGGWQECRHLPELDSLRRIPHHPNIISLYDYFLMPTTRELYFVFECMEGNLYQLIRTRKGRPLAGGLVSSIFSQVASGLHHIHESGYFHRDMKPENLLVTTTGLHNYPSTDPRAHPGAEDRDVAVIVKLADFGLARLTSSSPPYTEYVSTRWYRAPEVLLRSRDYSNPVDMWAFGTIMAELVNLRPLFPGSSEFDQIKLICEVLGDPSPDYGVDERGAARGGGDWPRGIRLARDCYGFTFPRTEPQRFAALFGDNVPRSLIECIADLLKYDPAARLTSGACVKHRYLQECKPWIPVAPTSMATRQPPARRSGHASQHPGASRAPLQSQQPRSNAPPSHSYPSPTHPELPRQGPPQLSVHQEASSSNPSLPPPPHIAPPPLQLHQPQPISVNQHQQQYHLVSSPNSLSPPSGPSHMTTFGNVDGNGAPLTHGSLNHLSMRSPARSDSVSIASPTSTSAPLTASSSPMSPQLMGGMAYASQRQGLELELGQSRGGVPAQLVDQLRDLDLPMDNQQYVQQQQQYEYQNHRQSPSKHLRQPQPQHQAQLGVPGPSNFTLPHQTPMAGPSGTWPISDRSRGKRRGSDTDADVEGPRQAEDSTSHAGGKGILGLVKKNKTWGLFGGGSGAQSSLPPLEEGVDLNASVGSMGQSHGSDDSSRRLLPDQRHPHPNGDGSGLEYPMYPNAQASSSAPHLRTQKAAGPSQPPPHPSQQLQPPPALSAKDEKKRRQELLRQQRAEKEEEQKARARAVQAKRDRLINSNVINEKADLGWGLAPQRPTERASERARPGVEASASVSSSMKALLPAAIPEEDLEDYQQMVSMEASQQRSRKARRRDMDDDHSMSSADTRPPRRLSIATVDSDPGPVRPMPSQRLRERSSAMGMNRATSHSSLRSGLSTGGSSLRGYSSSARSSTSLEQGFLEGFAQASIMGNGQGSSGPTTLSPDSLHPSHPYPYASRPQHHHHHPRAPQSSSSSLNMGTHPNALAPMLTNSQHSSTITLPPISTIGGNSLPPHPSLVDKGSHETLHPKLSMYGDIDMTMDPQTHSMFAVPTIVPPQDVQMTHHPNGLYSQARPSLPPFSEIASIADQGAEEDVGMSDAG